MTTPLPWLDGDAPSRATRIREEIVARLEGQDWLPVRTIRRQPRPQIQDGDLPALYVVIVDETESPEDEANAGPPRFIAETTIGISVVTGNDTPASLDEGLDDTVARIRRTLLTDPTFVRKRDALFEAIMKVKRGRLFPQDGAGYRAEGRLEITFAYRTAYEPEIPDDYRKTVLTARLAGAGDGTPTQTVVVDLAA